MRALSRFHAGRHHRSAAGSQGAPWVVSEECDGEGSHLHAVAYMPGGALAVTAWRKEEDFRAWLYACALGANGEQRMGSIGGWDSETGNAVAGWVAESAAWLEGLASHGGSGD